MTGPTLKDIRCHHCGIGEETFPLFLHSPKRLLAIALSDIFVVHISAVMFVKLILDALVI